MATKQERRDEMRQDNLETAYGVPPEPVSDWWQMGDVVAITGPHADARDGDPAATSTALCSEPGWWFCTCGNEHDDRDIDRAKARLIARDGKGVTS